MLLLNVRHGRVRRVVPSSWRRGRSACGSSRARRTPSWQDGRRQWGGAPSPGGHAALSVYNGYFGRGLRRAAARLRLLPPTPSWQGERGRTWCGRGHVHLGGAVLVLTGSMGGRRGPGGRPLARAAGRPLGGQALTTGSAPAGSSPYRPGPSRLRLGIRPEPAERRTERRQPAR